MQIKDSVALVTGANRGIGRTFVEALLERGATRVYAAARDLASLDAVVGLDPKRIRTLKLDVTSAEDARAARHHVEQAEEVRFHVASHHIHWDVGKAAQGEHRGVVDRQREVLRLRGGAAFHLGTELGGPARAATLEDTLREIADGRLTLIGDDLPHLMEVAGDKVEPGEGNEAVAAEREAARILLRWHERARRRFED